MGKTFILIQYKSYLGGWRVGAFPPPSQSVFLSFRPLVLPPSLLDKRSYVVWKVSLPKQLEDTVKPLPYSVSLFPPPRGTLSSNFPSFERTEKPSGFKET